MTDEFIYNFTYVYTHDTYTKLIMLKVTINLAKNILLILQIFF